MRAQTMAYSHEYIVAIRLYGFFSGSHPLALPPPQSQHRPLPPRNRPTARSPSSLIFFVSPAVFSQPRIPVAERPVISNKIGRFAEILRREGGREEGQRARHTCVHRLQSNLDKKLFISFVPARCFIDVELTPDARISTLPSNIRNRTFIPSGGVTCADKSFIIDLRARRFQSIFYTQEGLIKKINSAGPLRALGHRLPPLCFHRFPGFVH